MMYDETRKVTIAAPWITKEATSPITPDCVATKAISKENSLICPSLNPASQAKLSLSLNFLSRKRKTIGFRVNAKTANNNAGQIISLSSEILNCAPSEKKKSMRKNPGVALS